MAVIASEEVCGLIEVRKRRSSRLRITGGPTRSAGARLRVQGQDGVAAVRLRAIPFDVEAALSAIRERRTGTYPALEPLRAAVRQGLAQDLASADRP